MAAIASMTGAGFAAGDSEIGPVRVEVRSVNGRGLNLKLRLSSACSGLEAAVEERVRAMEAEGPARLTVAGFPVLDYMVAADGARFQRQSNFTVLDGALSPALRERLLAHFGAQTKLVYSGGGDLVCRSLDLTFEAALDDFVTIHQLCLVGAAA